MKLGFAIAVDAPKKFPVLFTGDVYENIEKAAQFGSETVEIHLREPGLVDAEKLADFCNAKKVAVSAIGTGLACVMDGFSLTHSDPAIREQAKARLFEYIKMAKVLNSVVILGSIRGKASDPDNFTEYETLLSKELGEVATEAQKNGVTVVLEVINRYELSFLNTAEEVRRFIDRIGISSLKMHLDTFHMNIEETNMARTVRDNKGYIGHVHVADNTRCYPGTGTINFQELMQALREIEYEGAVSMECFPLPDSETAAKKGLETLRKASEI